MENQLVYTYRYIWKDKDNKLFVRYVTDSMDGHKRFIENVTDDINVVSCMREYVSEVNLAYIGFTEKVKEEIKEDKDNEKTND